MPRDDRPLPVPWTTHALGAVVAPVVLLLRPVHAHGLTEGVHDPAPPLVGPALLLLGAALAISLAMLEVWALRALMSRWTALAVVVLTTWLLAAVGSLPVTFRLVTTSPVGHAELRAALVSTAVLLTVHVVAVVGVDRFAAREPERAGR